MEHKILFISGLITSLGLIFTPTKEIAVIQQESTSTEYVEAKVYLESLKKENKEMIISLTKTK